MNSPSAHGKWKSRRVKPAAPQAHFLADFRWQDGKTLHFSETQPTQWEVRLGERKNP